MMGKSALHNIIFKISISILLFLFFIVLSLQNAYSIDRGIKNILIIHSYYQGLTWTDNQDKGIRSVFESKKFEIELHTEYMGTKLVADDDYFNRLAEIYKQKYTAIKLSAIILTDDDALNFYLKYHNNVFHDVPAVFCGVNYLSDLKSLELDSIVTGVVEAFDIRKTIDISLKLHKNAKRIVIINDNSTTGIANKKVLQKILPEFASRASFTFFEDMNMEELIANIKILTPDDLILLMTFNKDKDGNVYSYDRSVKLISDAANVPIYGVWDFYLGKGIAGGMLTSGVEQGRYAALMAERIVGGEPVASIPIVKESPNRYMFDYNYLSKYDVDFSMLPAASIIINEPLSFYELNKSLVWTMIFGLLMFAIIIVLLLHNIQQQKRSATELKKSEERFDLAMLAVNDGIWDWDLLSNTVYFDSRYYSIAGYTPNDFPHSFDEWQKRVHPDDIEYSLQAINNHLSGKTKTFDIEFRFLTKSNNWMWLRGRGRSVEFDSEGKVIRMIGTHTDITDRKLAEEALRESEEYKKLLFESSRIPIVVMDAKTFKFIDCNTAAVLKYGYSTKDEILKKNHRDVSAEYQYDGTASPEKAIQFINLALSNGLAIFEWRHRKPNGDEWDAEVYLMSFELKGQKMLQYSLIDITLRKKAEFEIKLLNESLEQKVVLRTAELNKALKVIEDSNIELKQLNESLADESRRLLILNQKLEESEKELKSANQTKDMFFSIIAHDLRNPIGGIRNLLEMILMYYKDMEQSELLKLVTTSHNATVRTYELLENLLQWANFQRGKIDFNAQLDSIKPYADKAIAIVKSNANTKFITIENLIDNKFEAYFDNDFLYTILRNLLANSVKFTHEGGKIEIGAYTDKDEIIVYVKDTGVGINKDTINLLFSYEHQTSTAGTAGEKGTGLGLMLCKEFVEKQGGRIWVESEVGVGTTFFFSLPSEKL